MKTSKIALLELFNQGYKDAKTLSKMLGTPLRTVQRDLRKIKQNIPLTRQKGSGRPRKLDANDRRRLIQLTLKDDMHSSKDIQKELLLRGSPSVHSSTVRRYLNRSGYFSFILKKKPLLTKGQKKKRVEWCQQHVKTRWNNWVLSDESRFELF